MVAPLYTNLAKTAKALLTKYGKDVTVVRQQNSSYDASTGTVSKTETSSIVKGQLFAYKDRTVSDSGGLIKTGDRQCLLDAATLGFEIDPSTDHIIISGKRWAIIQAKKPVDEAVVYDLQVRHV